MNKHAWAVLCLLLSACPQTNSDELDMGLEDMPVAGKPADMRTYLSQCGHPGDKGNALGVGKFCTTLAECRGAGMKTNMCSSLGNGPTPSMDDTYFCTIYPCKPDAGTDACGDDATCVCGSGGGMTGCACTPNSCLGSPPDGGPSAAR